MPLAVKNHYVPQFYLKHWSADNDCIWQYKKLVPSMKAPLWSQKNTSEIAYERYLYAQNTGDAISDDFEKWISQEVENPAKYAINKMILGGTLTPSERTDISRFVLIQHLRTPAFFFHNQPKWRSLAQDAIRETGEKLQKLHNENRISPDCLKGKNPLPKHYQPQIKATQTTCEDGVPGYQIEANIGRATWLSTIRRVSETLVPRMAKYDWHIVNASESIEWPTSDDPVICLNFRSMHDYSFDSGICTNLGDVLLPVNPKQMIFAEIGNNHRIETIDKSSIFSAFVRRIILEHAFINVYSKTRTPFMAEECRPLVSEEKYKRLRRIMLEWNDQQSAVEADFIER